ncbi:CobW family GTP-binding protein [Roseospira navarrensis]|uniref:GTP-binding protein n=1 Tax=Roseospira navarrensis TaxID=140058 RepID=A0A7X1ZF26_9PROT|nr:GTP-binding protein [Roseospira navarrensis]MQX37385.1 GTP-binding protein [Roseospira navarrensis]
MSTLPVTVLTGFLGSGKTTLLNHLLSHPDMAETAVLVNEFGEVGLDHLLVRHVDEDIVLLNAGCLCCSVRGDMVTALRDLFLKRVRGEIDEFRRLLIETTGLADPAPILHTLMSDPLISNHYRLDGVVTVVDAAHGLETLDRQPESVKQAAVADRLVLSKTDVAAPEAIAALEARLAALNPGAPRLRADHGRIAPADILECGLFRADAKTPDVAGWLTAEALADAGHHGHDHHHRHDVNRHDERIRAFCLTYDAPVDWDALAAGLDLLVSSRGADVLRLKAIVNARHHDAPLALHGVQHMFHPPSVLPDWPVDPATGQPDRRTRLVFITRDLSPAAVERVLGAALSL